MKHEILPVSSFSKPKIKTNYAKLSSIYQFIFPLCDSSCLKKERKTWICISNRLYLRSFNFSNILFMNILQLNVSQLSQDKLVKLTRMLVNLASNEAEYAIDNPIVLKYLETLQKDADDLERASVVVKTDDKKNQLNELDRERDRYLSVFRRLIQVYELSDDNSAEATAYERLNDLWLKKYDSLAFLNMAVETQGIDNLLFDLTISQYADDVETLKLGETIEKIKIANDKFKMIYGKMNEEIDLKTNFDARSLKIELIETLGLFINYLKVLIESSEDRKMQKLYKKITDLFENYRKEIAERHAGFSLDEI